MPDPCATVSTGEVCHDPQCENLPAGEDELYKKLSAPAEAAGARLEGQLSQAQRKEAIGTHTGGIAHDINNRLGIILTVASHARARLRPEDPLQEPLLLIEQSAERAADLSRQLLGFSRSPKDRAKPVSVGEILERVAKIARRTFDQRIRVETRLAPEPPWVRGDGAQLEQAILNLCLNARDAMPEGGTLTLETSLARLGPDDPLRPTPGPPGDYVRITVADTGLGMEPQVMQRIFEPFFSTKEAGKSSGLGLAMVHGTVHEHGGFVHVESESGRGSRFTLHLPAVRRPDETPCESFSQAQRGSGTVLVVDDEPTVLSVTEKALKCLGYKVLTAENGGRACEIYASRAAEIDCVLLDMVMPEMSGVETCRRLRAMDPGVKVILSSGYSTGPETGKALEPGALDFIVKPYTIEALSQAVNRVPRH